MRVVVVLMALALFMVACQQDGQQQNVEQQEADAQEEQMMTRLTTSDNKDIAFTFYEGPKGGPGAILLHQLNRDRHDYDGFAPKLVEAGYSVISIDVRGHGESSGDWNLFSANDFRQIGLDIAAAKEYLGTQGADTSRILLIGASFTANAVINYAADDRDVKAVISLSPGLDYRGILTMPLAKQVGQAGHLGLCLLGRVSVARRSFGGSGLHGRLLGPGSRYPSILIGIAWV